jgi:hypothetical protein
MLGHTCPATQHRILEKLSVQDKLLFIIKSIILQSCSLILWYACGTFTK